MRYLDIYLNDHLLGATGGVELFRRAARTHASTPEGPALAGLVPEVERDRDDLLRVMRRLGVRVDVLKARAGWLGEKVGRLKPNGHLLSRSPLSDLVEVEALLLGVNGKRSLWESLRAAAAHHPELDPADLDRLVGRAADQAGELERLRTAVAARVLTP